MVASDLRPFESDQREAVAPRKRTLSFSNGDLDDPSQLEVLYEKCRDQVLRGIHPVPRATAISLAALQSFIDRGPYQEGVDRLISSHDLLPKEYARAREHEKNIVQEYRELPRPFSVPEAKRRYCELCRALPTYGVTFFLVKEPTKDHHRLTRRLFGVSTECVMNVDRKTKVVLKSWPLEQLRRWASSPTTFNIDFGDYVDGYYSVQTLEGDRIKKLIGDYVDIILKKSQQPDPKGIEGDEGGIMLEEHVGPARVLPSSLMDSFHRDSMASPLSDTGSPSSPEKSLSYPHPQQRQGSGIHTIVTTQEVCYSDGHSRGFYRDHTTTSNDVPISLEHHHHSSNTTTTSSISNTLHSIAQSQRELEEPLDVRASLAQLIGGGPTANTDVQLKWILQIGRQSVKEHLVQVVATAAQLIQWTSSSSPPPPPQPQQMQAAFDSAGSNVCDLVACVRELNALQPFPSLVHHTKKFSEVAMLLLTSLHNRSGEKRSTILSAGSTLGELACSFDALLCGGGGGDEGVQGREQLFVELDERIKAIATATATLVLQAKAEQSSSERLLNSATLVALSAGELIGLTRTLTYIISHPACQERIFEAVQAVGHSIEEMLATAVGVGDGALPSAAHATSDALHQLLRTIRQ